MIKIELLDDLHEIYKEISPDEHDLLQQSIFNGFRYHSKYYTYLARANYYGNYHRSNWIYLCNLFDNRCVNCQSTVIGGIPCKDHIIPVSIGGLTTMRNLQPLCRECNASKGKKIIDYKSMRAFKDGINLKPLYKF